MPFKIEKKQRILALNDALARLEDLIAQLDNPKNLYQLIKPTVHYAPNVRRAATVAA